MNANTKTIAIAVTLSAFVSAGATWILTRQSGPASNAVASAPATTKGPGTPPPGIVVEAVRVATVTLPQGITAVGSLRSNESVIVRSEIGGRITEISFKEGQRVTKGQRLFRLDGSIMAAELAQAKANLVLSKSKYDRAIDLKDKGFISQQARDEAENNLRVAEASVQLSGARLDKTEIRAPFSGVIGLRQVSVGDYVKDGQDLVNLESLDALKADFRVPEIYSSQVREGQSLQISLDAFPDKTYPAQVFAINPLVDQAGRAIVIRARVANAEGNLRPGMFARVRLLFNSRQEALVVPEQALMPQGDEQYVFRVVENQARRTKVAIGQRRDGNVEIVLGLSGTDWVVTAGQLKLREGVQVKIAEASGGAAPRGAAAGPAMAPGPASSQTAAPGGKT